MAGANVIVVDENGQPLKGVTVFAHSITRPEVVIGRAITDVGGQAVFTNLPEAATYDAGTRRGLSYRDRNYPGEINLQVSRSTGGLMNADYVVASDGSGTHLTLFGPLGAFTQAVADQANRFIWVCTSHVENCTAQTSYNALAGDQVITIASGVHNRASINKNFSTGGLFTISQNAPGGATIIWQNIRFTTAYADPWMVGTNGIILPDMEFDGVEWSALAGATYSYLFDNVNTMSASNTARSWSMRKCFGSVSNIVSMGATSNALGNFLMDGCSMTVDTVEKRVSGTSVNWGMSGSTVIRNCNLVVTSYLLHSNYDTYIQINNNQFYHSGNAALINTGMVQHGSHVAVVGNQYHGSQAGQMFAIFGSATGSVKNVLCVGNALTGPGSGTAIGVTFVSFGSAPSSIELWPNTYDAWTTNLDGAFGGGSLFTVTPGISTPGLVVGGGAGPSTPTPGSIVDIISPTGAGAGLTILLPRFPTTARPGSPTNGMLYYDSTLNRFVGYENSVWTDVVTNAGEGQKYAFLAGHGSPVGNAFTGYASWGTAAGISAYQIAVVAIAGLQAYWRCGEASGNLADTTVNANTMVAAGSPTYGVTGALYGDPSKAVSLPNNLGSYFEAANSASTNVADTFSVAFWINQASTTGWQEIYSRNSPSFNIYANGGTVVLEQDWNNTPIVSSTVALTAAVWSFVVITKSGATVKCYINGVDRSSAVVNTTLSASGSPTRLGRPYSHNLFPLNGALDEVALWNVAISAADVTNLYTIGTVGGGGGGAPAPANMSDGDVTGIRLFMINPAATFQTGFQSGPIAANITYQWPTTAPTAGQRLSSTAPSAGIATLSWVAAFGSVLSTKGDLWGYSTLDARVPVGANGQVLTADSTQALGLKWAAGASSPLTTKGDIWVYTTVDARLPIGPDTWVLTADSAQASGMKWAVGGGGGGGGGYGPDVLSETPSGTVDGTNATFTLAATPVGGIFLYKNGIRMDAGNDYTLTTATITFLGGSIPNVGDTLLCDYTTATVTTSPLTTKGDLWAYSTTNTRLAVGANGKMLVADSTQTAGLAWAVTFPPAARVWIRDDFMAADLNAWVAASATYDDEFDDTTGNSGTVNGLNARWAWTNQGTSTVSWAQHGFMLVTGIGTGYHSLFQNVPAGDWTFECEIICNSLDIGGLMALDGTATKYYEFGVYANTGAAYQTSLLGMRLNNVYGWEATWMGQPACPPHVYMRYAYVSATKVMSASWSVDGLGWTPLPGFTSANAITKIGIFTGGNASGNGHYFGRFRRIA